MLKFAFVCADESKWVCATSVFSISVQKTPTIQSNHLLNALKYLNEVVVILSGLNTCAKLGVLVNLALEWRLDGTAGCF